MCVATLFASDDWLDLAVCPFSQETFFRHVSEMVNKSSSSAFSGVPRARTIFQLIRSGHTPANRSGGCLKSRFQSGFRLLLLGRVAIN